MKYGEIVAPTIKELFIQRIEDMILSGELKPGDKLPSERELADEMKIGKTIVHEGIRSYPMELVDVLCVNEVEASALAGAETFEADVVLRLLHQKYPQPRLLLTAGSGGSYYLDAEQRLFSPCSGASVEQAMRLATKAAGIAVQRKGAAASILEIKELK